MFICLAFCQHVLSLAVSAVDLVSGRHMALGDGRTPPPLIFAEVCANKYFSFGRPTVVSLVRAGLLACRCCHSSGYLSLIAFPPSFSVLPSVQLGLLPFSPFSCPHVNAPSNSFSVGPMRPIRNPTYVAGMDRTQIHACFLPLKDNWTDMCARRPHWFEGRVEAVVAVDDS